MAAKKPRRRASGKTFVRETVMTSVSLDAETHAKAAYAASKDGIDKSAWIAALVRKAVEPIIIIDRRKEAESQPPGDSPGEAGPEKAEDSGDPSSDGRSAAAA